MTGVTMTMHGTEDFIVIAYHDPNGLTHLLTRWVDRSVTFTWDWRENWLPGGKPGDPFKYFPVTEVTDEDILRLANAWLEYLDAVIEVRYEAG